MLLQLLRCILAKTLQQLVLRARKERMGITFVGDPVESSLPWITNTREYPQGGVMNYRRPTWRLAEYVASGDNCMGVSEAALRRNMGVMSGVR